MQQFTNKLLYRFIKQMTAKILKGVGQFFITSDMISLKHSTKKTPKSYPASKGLSSPEGKTAGMRRPNSNTRSRLSMNHLSFVRDLRFSHRCWWRLPASGKRKSSQILNLTSQISSFYFSVRSLTTLSVA